MHFMHILMALYLYDNLNVVIFFISAIGIPFVFFYYLYAFHMFGVQILVHFVLFILAITLCQVFFLSRNIEIFQEIPIS